jgi:hypothetical protein
MDFKMDTKRNFKPGETISLTVVFAEPLDVGTNITIEYFLSNEGQAAADSDGQQTFQKWFLLTQQQTSNDRKEVVFGATVGSHIAKGTYSSANIAAEKAGARRQEVSLPGVPAITIDNPDRDDQTARIPGIKDISLK